MHMQVSTILVSHLSLEQGIQKLSFKSMRDSLQSELLGEKWDLTDTLRDMVS